MPAFPAWLAQQADPTPPPAPAPTPVVTFPSLPTPDQWTQDVLKAFAAELAKQATAFWDGNVLNGGINFVTRTPVEWTANLEPVRHMIGAWLPATYGMVALAVLLTGLAVLLREVTGHGVVVGQRALDILLAVTATTVFVSFNVAAVGALNALDAGIDGALPPAAPAATDADGIIAVLLVPRWVWFGGRFAIRMAYRLIFLAVLSAVAVPLLLCWPIPGLRWLPERWIRLYAGWMIGQPLAVCCLALARAMASPGQAAAPGMLIGVAALILAHDVAGLFGASGSFGVTIPLGPVRVRV